MCVCGGWSMCLDLYFGKIYPFKKIQIISHDWIPGNKFIVCCITFQTWSDCPKMLACFLITAKKQKKTKKKKVEHEKIPCFTRLKFVIGFSLQLQKVKFEGDLKHEVKITSCLKHLRNW